MIVNYFLKIKLINRKKSLYFVPFLLFAFLLLLSCGASKHRELSVEKKQWRKQNPKTLDQKSNDGYSVITAEVVKKKYQDKKGSDTEIEEWYVRRSAADYFIKFCESDVTPQEIEEALVKEEGLIKTLTLKVKILKGDWDVCEPESIAQSRIGLYMVIKEIR